MFMRTFIPLSMILGASLGDDALTMLFSDQIIRGHTLEEVYGSVEPVESMPPQHQRSMTKERFTEEYFKHRSEEICDFPIELVILQDATNSFSDDIVNMRRVQLQLMVEALAVSHPGSAFSLVSFRDKPLWPLGDAGDYCVRFGSPLSTDSSAIIADYNQLAISGGGDPPEAQFVSIVAASQSSTPGWGVVPTAAQLILVVTDAAPHFEGDGFNVYNLPPFSGIFDEANNDAQCVEQYYPTPQSVQSALSRRETYLASLVYDGSYGSNLPIESWQWFNSFIGQTAGFVHDIESDSSNFWDRLSKIISELEDIECGPSSTPAPPVTIAPTTPPAPTVAPTTPPAPTVAPTTPPAPTVAPTTSPAPTVAPTTPPAPTVAPTTPAPTVAPTTPPATTVPPATVTPIGTVETSLPGTEECPPCPPCEIPEECDPCCPEGVLIKLAYNPAKLHLEVEN